MANKTYYSQPKKGVGKIIAATACALALAVGTSAIGVGTSGFKDWSFSKWFPKTEQAAPEASENGGATITEGESSGMLLAATAIPLSSYEEYGITELAENAFTLSVTYTPEDTTYQQTKFTAAFKNPSSPWATGKTVTDYVTVTATGDTTATLTVLKPFSEQIIVTSTCNRNTAIKATTTVDYVGTWDCNLLTVGAIDDDICYRTAKVVNGTIAPDVTDGLTVTYDLSGVAKSMKSRGYTNFPESFTQSGDVNDGDFSGVDYIYFYYCYEACGSPDLAKYKRDLSSVILGGGKPEDMSGNEIFTYTLVSHRIYNGVNYGDVTLADGDVLELTDFTGFEVTATSMSYNSSPIITG